MLSTVTATKRIRQVTTNKSFKVRKDPELPDTYKETYKPGDEIEVYIRRPKQRGFRNRLYVPVKSLSGDGYIINDALYNTEG